MRGRARREYREEERLESTSMRGGKLGMEEEKRWKVKGGGGELGREEGGEVVEGESWVWRRRRGGGIGEWI